jgi:hypothetical protein
MKTLSTWIITLVVGVGAAASATQASVTPDTPTQVSITQVGSVGGTAKDVMPVASKKTGGEQVAWCFRRWNGTWGCIWFWCARRTEWQSILNPSPWLAGEEGAISSSDLHHHNISLAAIVDHARTDMDLMCPVEMDLRAEFHQRVPADPVTS